MKFLVQNWLEKIWFRDINALPVEIYKTGDITEDEWLTIQKIWTNRKDESKKIHFGIDIGKWSPPTGPRIYDYDFKEVFNENIESI